MPAFYSAPPVSQLPITPPDSGSGYGYNSICYPQVPYGSQHGLGRHDTVYDYPQSYMQPPVAPAPPTYQYPPASYSNTSLPPIQSYYEPMGAPILPPLRIHEHVGFADDYQRRLQVEQNSAAEREQQRQAAKEEKATGGVSAKLDYDMERMTDFVTEATQSMYAFHSSGIRLADIDVSRSFQHSMTNPPSFRKWVLQVLSATRLPSATILLSLHYLNDRVAKHPETITRGENQIYRLLAVALILGSKFLDDNTFINRSWSDVTAIKVTELNLLEKKWLDLIHWELHIDQDAPNGLPAWLSAWKDYDAKNAAKALLPARLSPLDTTNVHRTGHSHRGDRFSPYPTPSYSAASSSQTYEPSQPSARSSQYLGTSTPYSSTSDPWSQPDRHALDDFYKHQHRYPTLTEIDDVNRRASEQRAAAAASYAYSAPSTSTASYYQTPVSATSYGSAWDHPQGSWGNVASAPHRYDCGCAGCGYAQGYRPYGHEMGRGYGVQSVMG